MKSEQYHFLAEKEFLQYHFTSIGHKGEIKKVVQFQDTGYINYYNLAFGDRNQNTGGLDDLAVSNNGDTEKVLLTVVAVVYVFFNHYPDAKLLIVGSTPARTRLY